MKNRIIVSFLAVMTIMSVSLSAMVGGRRAPAVVAPKASRPVAVPQAPAVPQTPKFNANAIKAKIEELLRVDGTTKTSVIAAVKKISTGQAFTAWITALEQSLNEARDIKTLTLDDAKQSGIYALVLFVRGISGYTAKSGKIYKGITREFNEQFLPLVKPVNVDPLNQAESRLYQEREEQASLHGQHAAERLADLLSNNLFTGPMAFYHEALTTNEQFLNTLEFSNEFAEQYFTEVIEKLINNARGVNGSMWTRIKAVYKAHPYLVNTLAAVGTTLVGSTVLYKSGYSEHFNAFVDEHELHSPHRGLIAKAQALWTLVQRAFGSEEVKAGPAANLHDDEA